MNYWVATYRIAWGTLAVLFVVGGVCVFLPKVNTLRALQKRRLELQAENRMLEEKIQEFKTKQERFLTDPEYVERVAHELRLVKPNETIFIVTNQPTGDEGP